MKISTQCTIKQTNLNFTTNILLVQTLSRHHRHQFKLKFSKSKLKQIAKAFQIRKLSHLKLSGELRPQGIDNWLLYTTLMAHVIQDCVITLAPVKTRINTKIRRHFIKSKSNNTFNNPIQINLDDNDDDQEILQTHINLADIALETLSITLPLYPRLAGATFKNVIVKPDSILDDDDQKSTPFAILAELKKHIKSG